MKLVNAGNAQIQHFLYSSDGTITAGGTPQLVLARSLSRSYLLIQNLSNGPMWLEMGSARATCTISSGGVNAVSVANAGFNFTKPPVVLFMGGGPAGGSSGPLSNKSYIGLAQPGAPAPSRPAKGHAVLTGSAVSSIVIDDPGAGYVLAPYVFIYNSDLDPAGCAAPSATSGILLSGQGDKVEWNGTCCPTDPVAIFGADTAAAYLARWMD